MPTIRRRPELAATILSAVLAAACGGGGGSAGFQVGFAAPNSTIDEDGGAANVLLVLEGPVGGALGEPASVLVSDSGTGSAGVGGDYTTFAPVTVTFPAGSIVGAQLAVQLTPLPDDLIEGAPETVVLTLGQASGASLGAHPTTAVGLGDGEVATLRFTSTYQLTPDESSTLHTTEVELLLPAGTTLAVDLGVNVEDDGIGTATAGADYQSLVANRIVFPAGSPSGTRIAVGVDVLDDLLAEGDESVRLSLVAPDPGAVLGGMATHQVVIRDDETPTGQFLYVSQGASGTENPMADQSPVWLGNQVVGLGPNTGTLVRLTNLGNAQLGVGGPQIAGEHAADFSIELESASLPPPPEPPDPTQPGFVLAPDAPAPVGERLSVEQGQAFELEATLLGALEGRSEVTLHGFPLPGRADGTLALASVPLPFTEDAQLVVDGVPQPGGPRAALDGLTLWTGTVLESPEARVFLALSPAGAQGFVQFPESPDRLVHVVTERAPGPNGEPALVRVVEDVGLEALGVLPPPEACSGAREVPLVADLPSAQTPALAGGEPPIESIHLVTARLAIETDYQLYLRFGSTGALITYVTSLIAAVSDRYVTDVQAQLSISYLGVYSTPADPWSSQDTGGDAGDVLDEFRASWTSGGGPMVGWTLAHFISGANLGGGVAYVGVLCNQSFGFGVSGNVVGNINWGAWTGASASFTWDFVVVAHELGHNFGTNHTHSYCPPLDQCYTNCSGTTACGTGTLMSYCHLCAGGMNNIRLQFHPVVANTIRSTINASCLGYSVLPGGDWVQYRVSFEPKSESGLRTAELRLPHGAPNLPSPLRLELSANAQP